MVSQTRRFAASSSTLPIAPMKSASWYRIPPGPGSHGSFDRGMVDAGPPLRHAPQLPRMCEKKSNPASRPANIHGLAMKDRTAEIKVCIWLVAEHFLL